MNSTKDKNVLSKILVVDDDHEITRLVMMTLKFEGYQLESADSGEKALEKIKSFEPDLILLDMNMPGLSGLETLKLVRKMDSYVGVIFVSARSETQNVIDGLDAGADDYICKPFNPHELLARVRTQLRIKDLTDSLSEANEKLHELAHTDELTGLFNMRSLYPKLDIEMSRAKRLNSSVAVVMMDLDHFKAVNDDHDHIFGSTVIQQVGHLIGERIRDVDFAARYGGDEYIIVLTAIHKAGAQAFCDRLRMKIEETNFTNEDFKTKVTSSIGFAISEPGSKMTGKDLVKWADRALYDAKEGGRNQVSSYDLSEEISEEDTAEGYKFLKGNDNN